MRKGKSIKFFSIIILIILFTTTSNFTVPKSSAQLTTDKWPTEWRPYGAYLDEIKFVVFTKGEVAQAMLALENGDVDAYDELVLQDYFVPLMNNPDIEVTFTPSLRYRAITLNSARFPTNITAFRRAIAFGFDKYLANIECIGGIGQPQDSYIPLISTEWSVEATLPVHFYESDFISGNMSLENAGFKDLDGDGWREYDTNNNGLWDAGVDLEDNTYADGGILEFYPTAGYDPAIKACQIAVDGLEAMGVRATIVEMDFGSILDRLFTGDAWAVCWTEAVPMINTVKLLYDNFRTDAQNNKDPYNYYHFSNATIDEVLDNMVASLDLDEVKDLAEEASLLLAFEQPQIVCYNDVNIGAYRTDKFEGQMEFAGAGWASGDNTFFASKLHLKESLGGPYGGTLKYCLSDIIGTYNPYLQKTSYEATVFQYIYEPLMHIHPETWDLMPGLAYDWDIEATTASGDIQDGQKYTFYLYENETWHDGVPFTSADVESSIVKWRDSPYHGPEMWDIYKIERPDAYTIELYVNKTGFFEFADTTLFYITPEHIWKDVTNVTAYNPDIEEVVGTGPYFMDSRVPGEYINLKRNTGWRWDIRDIPEPPTTTTTISTSSIETSSEVVPTTVLPCENNEPVVDISGIKDEGTYSGRVTIDISISDESNIVKAEIRVKGGHFDEQYKFNLYFEGDNTWSGTYHLDTTDFPDDTYDITITVMDACGNEKKITMDITFDNGIEESTETGTKGVPSITSGYGSFSILMSLSMTTFIYWRRRRN
ncbi:MAG: ABC transporter substrate-binding protein [Candidatus Thorarchaeota archaeon]